MVWLILLGVVVVLGLYIAGIYNRLVNLLNRYKNSFAQIEVQLKRRHDLIPNLVNTAKGYLKHERETLEAVVQARAQATQGLEGAASDPTNAQAMQQMMGAETALNGALGRLLAVVESYPDLKGNATMQQLMEELTSTENKVSFSRQAYNDQVTAYNIYRQSFPPVVFAGMLGHGQDAVLLEFDSEKIAEAPEVSFD